MLSKKHVLISLAALALSAGAAFAQGKGPVVGVSWSNFQEERWKTDEAAIKAAVEKAGAPMSRPMPSPRRPSSSPISRA